MMHIFTSTLLLLLLAVSSPGYQPPLGYRFPGERDYFGDWQDFRSSNPTPFHAVADFNGDSRPDDAWILLATEGKGWGLFVFVGAMSGKARQVVQLEKDTGTTPAQRLGVAVVPPGGYETLCAQEPKDCGVDTPPILNLALPAIDFFMFESANSYFWWDSKSKLFKRTWISD